MSMNVLHTDSRVARVLNSMRFARFPAKKRVLTPAVWRAVTAPKPI